jgi:arylsulfatase A-like enzyme
MGAWVADLLAKGYDFKGREDVFRPRRDFKIPADRGFRYIPTEFPAADDETTFLTDYFIKWLLVRRDRPWFAHFVFFRPHPPLIAPEPYNAAVHPKDVVMPFRARTPEEETQQHPLLRHAIDKLRIPGEFDELNPLDIVNADDLEIRQMRATYFGLINECDVQLGRIIEHLKNSGQYDRTLIVVTSDHAEMLGEHYMWGKEIYFDQCFHVPLVIRDPRPDSGRGLRVTELTQAIDIMPTILDWIGQPVPRTCDGRSLAPFLQGQTPVKWRDVAYFEHDFRNVRSQAVETALGITSDECCYAVIRGKRWKYVHFAALPPLLFDLETDPHESTNLAPNPAMRDVLLECARRMLDWRLTAQERTMTNIHLGKGGIFVRD